ncbi:MAG: aspartate--tRNA ligase [Clostridiales bacterium]|nr:aspartate--tRNA ligase [Clostridiales bacterium]
MGESIKGLKRTHMCGELTSQNVGEDVVLMGWVQRRRDLGGLIFVTLRDRTGIIQLVFDQDDSNDLFNKAATLRSEYVIACRGQVINRAPEAINPNMATGEIEVKAEELRVLSKSETPPFYIEDNTNVSEALRYKYRYLDLRRPEMQRNLMIRHKIASQVRNFLNERGFLEIETPMLTKSTPEGARDYLVPSRVHPGKFYALPQSPQLFKQLLMLAGYDRYYQIVRCFRDEDLRADRQPEFTQIDIEMSFVEVDDVLAINEALIAYIFKQVLDVDIPIPFKRMTYKEAMERYGSDKPDTRFGLELVDVSSFVANSEFKVFSGAVKKGGSVRAINAKGAGAKFSRRDIDSLGEFVKTYRAKGLAWINVTPEGVKSPIAKFLSQEELNEILNQLNAEPGDLLLFIADENEVVFQALGQLRLELARRLDIVPKDEYNLLWITEFPLFEYDQEEGRYVAKHHPFTSPMDEDLHLLESEPEKVRAKAYDMVLNGNEIGGGSIRIHDISLQERMFKALGFTMENAWEQFGFLLEAFKFGAPPHGGIAYGLDRIAALLAGKTSIRDVIAFPKVQNASDLMTNAPSFVDEKQLNELHISVDKKIENKDV